MPGSPRIERAASLRIQHPNLSTEDAMKLAGYTDEEARDTKRQSNVRQKTHRLTSKGKKRRAPVDLAYSSPALKRPVIGDDQDFQPLPITFDSTMQGLQTPDRKSTQSFVGNDGIAPSNPPPLPYIGNQFITSSSKSLTPSTPSTSLGVELHISPRADKAARFWLDNPNLSIEHSMRLSRYNQEEISDPKKQNDVRQTANQMAIQLAAKTEKHSTTPSELRTRLSIMEKKIDALTQFTDRKLQEMEAKIEKNFTVIIELLQNKSSNSPMSSSYVYQPYGPQYGQAQTKTNYRAQHYNPSSLAHYSTISQSRRPENHTNRLVTSETQHHTQQYPLHPMSALISYTSSQLQNRQSDSKQSGNDTNGMGDTVNI
jgi:hypothetical protein